ncbi:ATP-grasp domain-containing protein [Psychrobacter sp. AOP29-E1-4]|uniref:ATP-grasp domain-containing protein n=1 Tax=Psychrobacter sp. AOP29-E1-4 TaxID=3457703 RepID=UPI00403518E0
MKVAIHHRKGSFSDRWIEYCKIENIDYKIVNAFDSDIINQVKDYDVFMWHHHHGRFEDVLAAKKILFSLEQAGIRVFPDFNTGWHFDDKVAQKYLLEAIDAPLVPSYIFYEKEKAINWAKKTSYPKVFKLKGGAGATNVKLVKTQAEALKLIHQAFGKGFAQFDRFNNLKERYNKYRSDQDTLLGIAKGAGRLIIPTNFAKQQLPEKGYVYFQDFMPDNNHDVRVIVIGEKAFAIKRIVRENDFRASGSGNIIHNEAEIDLRCLEIAFDISRILKSQCLAYDFIFDGDNKPLVVEISYGFSIDGYIDCPGYWDNSLQWHQGVFNPYGWMVNQIEKQVSN